MAITNFVMCLLDNWLTECSYRVSYVGISIYYILCISHYWKEKLFGAISYVGAHAQSRTNFSDGGGDSRWVTSPLPIIASYFGVVELSTKLLGARREKPYKQAWIIESVKSVTLGSAHATNASRKSSTCRVIPIR
jgi:hypothetical protein